MIRFEYNGRMYAPSNFEKKLQALGITKDDITIIEDTTAGKQKVSEALGIPQYTYRLNVNTVLVGYTKEQLDTLKKWYNVND